MLKNKTTLGGSEEQERGFAILYIMENISHNSDRAVIRERALLISPTSLTSEIPASEASQGVTVEMLRSLDKSSFKQRLQKALGALSTRP